MSNSRVSPSRPESPAPSSGEAAAMLPSLDYWQQSREPLTSLAFVAPLLAVYELGVVLLGRQAARNGVDVWLRGLLDLLGTGQYFLLPADGLTFGLFLVSLVLTALLQFFISYGMAMLAFWLLEISTFIFILFAFEYIASGHLFPLDFLPQGLQQVLFFTPFPYQMYFPVSIYMGQSSGVELWRGLAMQLAWLLLAYVFARFMWRRGVRKYAAFGG